MAKKKKCPECPAGEKWAVPYADFLSLLLALFIALYAISAVNIPTVEIHMTNIQAREDFRQKSLIAPVCVAQICGFGTESYKLGLKGLVELLKNNKSEN